MMDLYGNGLLLGEKTLDSLWMRQNLTMNNIANVDTPGFKSQYMIVIGNPPLLPYLPIW